MCAYACAFVHACVHTCVCVCNRDRETETVYMLYVDVHELMNTEYVVHYTMEFYSAIKKNTITISSGKWVELKILY